MGFAKKGMKRVVSSERAGTGYLMELACGHFVRKNGLDEPPKEAQCRQCKVPQGQGGVVLASALVERDRLARQNPVLTLSDTCQKLVHRAALVRNHNELLIATSNTMAQDLVSECKRYCIPWRVDGGGWRFDLAKAYGYQLLKLREDDQQWSLMNPRGYILNDTTDPPVDMALEFSDHLKSGMLQAIMTTLHGLEKL